MRALREVEQRMHKLKIICWNKKKMWIEILYLILLFLPSHLASSVVDGYLVRLFNYVSFNNTVNKANIFLQVAECQIFI